MDVALPVPANGGVFTYRLREGSVEPGRRVQVPLGRRSATGIVLGPASAARGELRDVVRVLDDAPLLAPDVLHLARWAAAHYLAPLGLAVRAALPPGIDLREELCAELTAAGEALLEGAQRTFLPAQREAASRTRQLLRALRDGRALRPAQLRALEKRGLVALSSTEARPRVRAAQVEMVAAAPGAQVPPRSPRQAAVLAWLLARDPRGVPVEELLAAFPGARPHLRKLAARRLVAIREEPAGAAALVDAPWGTAAIRETPAQAAALVELRAALDARRYAPFLLHGVTASGKTHVYMEAIAHARAQGRGALALVPEIALTPQLAGRFRARFGDDVAVLHSGLSERERLSEWERVRSGRAGLVVGARSAVFAPVHGLGIVVVDEEHEPSYKQEDRLRYHARDLALVRAREANAVVVLGSATPSLETLRRAYEGKLRTLRLPERVDGRALPPVEIVDRKSTLRPADGEPALITPELAAALRETVARREQAILYLNKRGHVRSLLCRSCGAALGCPNCSVALVLHRAGGTALRCHLCGHEELPRPCAACGGDELVPLAAGTERVEEELRALLPEARAARLDRDSATGPGKAAALLARFARREIDVLIGTQMIAKGHDFPGVTLVGALDADGPLRLPDFRAGERCVQLLAQVAGRAGRGEQPGRVILQAFRPTDPAVVAAAAHDYEGFARGELERRGALSFPPYARLCAVRIQGNVEARAQAAAERLGASATALVRRGERADVLGPAPAPIARIRGKHRFQLVLRANEHGPLHRICRALAQVALPAGVDVTVDVDPVALV